MEGWESLLISHAKYIKDGKVLDHLGFQSKVFPGPLTDLSAWFLHLKPTAGCQISTLIFNFFLWRGGLYKYPMKKYIKDGKVLEHLELMSKVLPGPLTD